MAPYSKTGICSFCSGPYDKGNNPAPLVGGRCCDECNAALVIPVRWHLLHHQLKKSATAQRKENANG